MEILLYLASHWQSLSATSLDVPFGLQMLLFSIGPLGLVAL